MSFIYKNKNLNNELISIGQSAFNPNIKADIALTNAIALADKLESEIKNTGVGSQLKEVAASPLTIKDCNNLTSFISWIINNQVTWNNKRFAWNINEADSLKQQIQNKIVSSYIENATTIAYVNKNDLISFISYLRDFETKDNEDLKTHLNNIIDQANSTIFKQSPLSKETEKEVLNIDPTTSLDSLSDPLDLNDPETGPKKLTWDILSNKNIFYNWLSTLNIKMNDNIYKAHDIQSKFGTIYNQIVKILFDRAQNLKDNFSSEQLYNSYINKLKEYSGINSSNSQSINQNTTNDKSNLKIVTETLPLLQKSIDINKIKTFITKVKPFLSNNLEHINAINIPLNKINNIQVFTLTTNADEVLNLPSINRNISKAIDLVFNLKLIIAYTSYIITDYYNTHIKEIKDEKAQNEFIDQMQGGNTYSYYNVSSLNQLADNLKDLYNKSTTGAKI